MLDPYTAFGLVANIVQLVDFGLKIISNAREISSTGLPTEYKHLETIANSVTVLTKTLSTTQSGSLISGCLSEDEQVRDSREKLAFGKRERERERAKRSSTGSENAHRWLRKSCHGAYASCETHQQ
jgi:hypothetical protein